MKTLTLLLLVAALPLQAAERCPGLSNSGKFSTPVSVECADKGTIGFLAPSPMDMYPRIVYRGSPSFVSVTANENWKRSIFADSSRERLNRLEKLIREYPALHKASLETLLNTATPKLASSAEELDQIVQARCLLFASSSICKNAFEEDEAISCEGKAAALAGNASDQSSDAEKIKQVFSVAKEIGISHISYAAFFAAIKYLAPSIVEPVSALVNSKLYFDELRDRAKDTNDVVRIERTNWFQAFIKGQKNRDMEAYCYKGSLQFRHRISEALWLLKTAYDELPEDTAPKRR